MKPDDHYESHSSEESPSSSTFHAAYERREAPLRHGLHVDLGQDWEIHLWTRHFGCTEQELRRAVDATGTSAQDVRAWLRRASPKN